MVKAKRGRKQNTLFGYSAEHVDTWAQIDGKWVYIGKSCRRLRGVTTEDGYNYYTASTGHKARQRA